jgi:signal transduction histidine kinase
MVDEDRLHQVLTNLVSNAIKFTPEGEAVRVATTATPTGDWRIEVVDRGPGIPEDFRARIFQPFAQADGTDARRLGGTGLGLSIAKSLIERMGGRIGFESASGQGTRFFVDLPMHEET